MCGGGGASRTYTAEELRRSDEAYAKARRAAKNCGYGVGMMSQAHAVERYERETRAEEVERNLRAREKIRHAHKAVSPGKAGKE
jgi:hypothetical protein